MKDDLIKKHLVTLGADFLAERLIALSIDDNALSKELEFLILKNDPKKLAKKIAQQINGIKRSTRFIPWNQTHELTDRLYQITRVIENDLLPQSPQLSIELIEKLFNGDESIHERADDSHGDIGMFYFFLSELWGKVWLNYKDRDTHVFAQKIYDLLKNNGYASKDRIIEHSAKALGSSGLVALEELITENKATFSEYSLPSMYEAIADGLGDVDKYIDIVKSYSVINENTVCDIAQRLINKWRGTEAINWLLKQPDNIALKGKPQQYDPNKVSYSKRFDLLINAYEAETMLEEAQALRWILFEKTLSGEFYKALIKHQDTHTMAIIKDRAFKFSCEKYKGSVSSLLGFLSEIQAFEKLDSIIKEKYDVLSENDYTLYRPISNSQATAGYLLSACLLRRKLVDGILNQAISKYYKYAVSDLKIAHRHAKEVQDWQGFQNHDQYIDTLRNCHGRKSAFWSQVEKASVT